MSLRSCEQATGWGSMGSNDLWMLSSPRARQAKAGRGDGEGGGQRPIQFEICSSRSLPSSFQDDLMTTKLSLGVTMRSLRPPRPAPRTVKKTAPSLVVEKSKSKAKKKVVVEEDNDSDASSTFSLEAGVGPEMARRPPHLGGSTKNLRAGGITLNAARLA